MEQERKRRKEEEKKEEKKRKKEKKREEKKKKEDAAGGRGVKEEEAAEDIEEVKAQVEDVAVEGEGAGGEGVLVATPWLRGEAGHASGLSQANQRLVLTLRCAQGALGSGYSPDAPFFSSPEATYVTLRCAFRHMLRHRIRNKGGGGGAGGTGGGGGMGMEAPGKKAPIPHPRTTWGRGFDAGQSFFGPGGALDAELPLGDVARRLGGTGVGEAVALRAQDGVHPPVQIHFGGGV